MSKLLDRLKRLYQLAVLRPEEENDEGRKNEARNAAFLLLKTARENGVKIKFEVKGEVPEESARGFYNPPRDVTDFEDILSDIFRGASRPPPPTARARQREEDFLERLAKQEAERKAHEERMRKSQREDQSTFVWPNHQPGWAGSGVAEKSPYKHTRVKSVSGQPPLIVAKHGGTCKVCRQPFNAGDEVWWARGVGCAHHGCDPQELVRTIDGL